MEAATLFDDIVCEADNIDVMRPSLHVLLLTSGRPQL